MDRTWTTEGLPGPEQFSHWREVVAEAFVPVTVTRQGDGGFASGVAARVAGPLRLSRIASEAQTVTRSPSLIARAPGDTVFLNLPLTDGTFARQDGRTARLAAGDFTIVDSSRPFELGFSRRFHQISVQIPREVLSPQALSPERTAVRIDGSAGYGAIASSALRAFARDRSTIDRLTARSIAGHLCELISVAIVAQPQESRPGAHAQLLAAADELIESRLDDPRLSPTMVAELISVSPRQLHRLFSARGTTFGRQLLERRLAVGRLRLVEPARRPRPVSEIAREVGFEDPSYFARAFRARYGVTPRQARARAAE